MPAFDFTLCLRMHRCAAHMAHLVGFDIFRQFACDIAGTVVRQQPGLMLNSGIIAPRRCQGHVQRVGDILGAHIAAQLPCDDIAREVVEHGGQVHPSPANDLEVGEVCLPQRASSFCHRCQSWPVGRAEPFLTISYKYQSADHAQSKFAFRDVSPSISVPF